MASGRGVRIVGDFAAWGVIQASLGYLAHRLPLRCFEAERWLWRERGFEDAGRLYLRLGIRRWKHLLPDAGPLLRGGFSLRRMAARDPSYLGRFVAETRRAEAHHWAAVAATPVFALWNPPSAMALVGLYALAANLPCVAAQRYNRIRLTRVLARAPGGGPVGRVRVCEGYSNNAHDLLG